MEGRSGRSHYLRNPRERPNSMYRAISLESKHPHYYRATLINKHGNSSGSGRLFSNDGRLKAPSQNDYYNQHSVDMGKTEQLSLGSISWFEDSQSNIVPKEVLYLLSEEANNLQQYRSRTEEEKLRINNDFDDFCKQIVNILDDLRTSLLAQIDMNYRDYVGRYSRLRKQVQEFKMVKRELQTTMDATLRSPRNNATNRLVKEIEHDIDTYREMAALGRIVDMQKDHYAPLKRLTQELITLGKHAQPMYQRQNVSERLAIARNFMSNFTQDMCKSSDCVQSSIVTLASLHPVSRNEPVTVHLNNEPPTPCNEPNPLSVSHPQSADVSPLSEYFLAELNTFGKRPTRRNRVQRPVSISGELAIGPNSCSLITDSLERVNVMPSRTISVEAQDILLCCTMLSNRYVCVGSRDGNIYVYTLQGVKVIKLVGHKAGICTLTELKHFDREYLASGGDLGCGSIILWQLSDWKTKKKWTSHDAAVSSIVALTDNETFASSSYDKTIKIYSLRTEQVLVNIPNHTSSPVTLICCNTRGNRLISASLDNSLNIWRIKRSEVGNHLETVNHETCLNIGDIVCQLSSLTLRSDLVVLTTNNGKALLVDIRTGEVRRTIDICSSPIVQLAIIESQNRPSTFLFNIGHPYLLMCSTTDRNLILAESDTGTISSLDLNNMASMSFGCGVGPKLVFCGSEHLLTMCVLNQSDLLKEVRICSLELRKFK